MIHVYYDYNTRGPGKVIKNLIEGLNLCGVKYEINTAIENVNAEDYVISLQSTNFIDKFNPKNLLIGPNICTLPIDNGAVMGMNYKKIITPSEWVKKLYAKFLPEEKICVWPVGIDTDYFSDFSKENKTNNCLIYFKRRSQEELNRVSQFIESKNIKFNIIKYGDYSENDFIREIKCSKFGFILDNTESQGIAIQEMMSCNLPLFVWDVENWRDRGDEFLSNATSIPFWDSKCGEVFTDEKNINEKFNIFLKNIDLYTPRNYILENLNLKKQALELIKLF